ncbi:alginate export family protein [Ferrovibrio terrae]|uniref:alginate export family protein n=1 Tax=Ferrovibrio terrae TaxID=2594003 RepID=UPI003137DA4D
MAWRTTGVIGLFAALICAINPVVAAEDEHEKAGQRFGFGDLEIGLTLDAGLGLFGVSNAQNGLGSLSSHGRRKGGRNWAEAYVTPGIDAAYFLNDTTLYGGVKVTGSATRGDGEAQRNSVTDLRPTAFGLSEAYLGWKSGLAFTALGEDAIDISAGRQGFVVGDGFLIADGTLDSFRRNNYVLGPRSAFDRTAILRINTEPVRADLFHLESNTDQQYLRGKDAAATSLHGGNIEWFASSHRDHGRSEYEERQWYLGATVLTLTDADQAISPRRDGMTVYALRSGGALLSSLGEGWQDAALYGEIARERNGATGRRLRAEAWYVEPQYTFSALPWQPRLSYRYMHFSGDNNANDTVENGWDSLFSAGGPRGYGSWDLGEIYARYVGGNSNLNSHMTHLKLQPMEDLSLGAIWYRHNFDKRDYANGVRSERLLDEVDVYALWTTPLPGLSVATVLGAARAGDGRRQQLGTTDATDRTTWLGQMVFSYSF